MNTTYAKHEEAGKDHLYFVDWCYRTASIGLHQYNPYHNMRHTQCVMESASRCYLYERPDAAIAPRELLFAAAMHDYDHTGGVSSDDVNIALALNGVEARKNHIMTEGLDFQIIEGLIECTEYSSRNKEFVHGTPYDYLWSGTDFLGACLRDADLMAIYATDATAQLQGLYLEVLVLNPGLHPTEFMKANRKFLEEATMYTDFGKLMKERQLQKALQKFEYEFITSWEN